jgi:hypothetical protein
MPNSESDSNAMKRLCAIMNSKFGSFNQVVTLQWENMSEKTKAKSIFKMTYSEKIKLF